MPTGVPVKNDVERCWDCFLEEELQAEPWASSQGQACTGCVEDGPLWIGVSTPCLT